MKIKTKIYIDALKAMRIPMLLHTIAYCAEGILTVFTATILGQFADSVFRLDFSLSARHAASLGLALFAMIAFLPSTTLVADIFMLKYALVHDRMILGRFLDKKYDSILQYELGDIQNRLDWDPTELRCYLVICFHKGFMVPVTLAFLLFSAMRLSPAYTLIVFILSLLKLAVPLAVRKLEGRYDKDKREYTSQLRSLEAELTQQPCMVKLYGLGGVFSAKAGKLYRDYFDRTEKQSIHLSAAVEAVSSFTGTFCTLAILLSGSLLAANGMITPGTVAAMYGYSAVFNMLLENMGFLIRNTPIIKNTAERLIMFYQDAEENLGDKVKKITTIECNGLSYAYGDHQALSHASFSIHSGEKIAFCGSNGSGKSTLMKVMLSLLTGYGGSLRINGKELSQCNPAEYRRHIAYAPQDPYLFEGTVLENIRIGNPDISDAALNALLDKMGIAYLAERRRVLGSGGLSGGEKQKISIARALVRDTDLLFLDEPGNHLDQATLDWLCTFLCGSNKTIVFISHDEQLTTCADRVITLPG